jgi:hypothetical protein
MDNRIKCNSCGKIYEFDYRKRQTGNCIYCGSTDTEFVTKLPLIYHPRQFVQWPLDFKKERYEEILDYLKNVYRHNCKTRDEESGSCSCKERDFQNEIVEYFLRFYDDLFDNLPFGLKTTKEKERYALGNALVIMEERPLWSPEEAISWYRSRDNSYPPVAEVVHMDQNFTGTKRRNNVVTHNFRDNSGRVSYTHRLRGLERIRGRIDIDIFNVAIELKIFKNQLSVRDLLAECLRDKIVADDFVIGVLFGFPTKEELNGEPTLSEKEREYLGRIIEENLRYHKYMFEQANIQLVTIGL